ncbi:MAG: PHP domain-containing protein, partial [Planctomycetota bacterium]|nr:PHP domain-containing protein [Planctomycetota bacterium]
MSSYVPLWCKTNFSFLEGGAHPEELVAHAQAVGVSALAVTDRDGVQGIVRAYVAGKEHGVRIVVGSEVTVADGSTAVLLVQDRAGYANLCRLVTTGRLRSAKGACVVEPREVLDHADGLVALWKGDPVEVGVLKDAFGSRLYALVTRHRRDEDAALEARVRAVAKRHGVPTVAGNE